jgi:hypothetical protein
MSPVAQMEKPTRKEDIEGTPWSHHPMSIVKDSWKQDDKSPWGEMSAQVWNQETQIKKGIITSQP